MQYAVTCDTSPRTIWLHSGISSFSVTWKYIRNGIMHRCWYDYDVFKHSYMFSQVILWLIRHFRQVFNCVGDRQLLTFRN